MRTDSLKFIYVGVLSGYQFNQTWYLWKQYFILVTLRLQIFFSQITSMDWNKCMRSFINLRRQWWGLSKCNSNCLQIVYRDCWMLRRRTRITTIYINPKVADCVCRSNFHDLKLVHNMIRSIKYHLQVSIYN